MWTIMTKAVSALDSVIDLRRCRIAETHKDSSEFIGFKIGQYLVMERTITSHCNK